MLGLLLVPVGAAQYKPDQIHVGLAGTIADSGAQPMDVSQLVIHWSVAQPYLASHNPVLKYRINNESERTLAASLVGSARDTSPPTATEENEVLPVYAARIRAPLGANVTYQVGDQSAGMSPPRTVRMLPIPRHEATLVAFSNIGYDGYGRTTGQRVPGTEAPQEMTIRMALNQTPDVVLLPGMLGLSSSNKPWDGFMRSMEPLISTVPTTLVPGEADTDNTYHQIYERWVLPHLDETSPTVPNDEVEKLWHGFSVGQAYVVGLDSTQVCSAPPQLTANQPATPPCTEGVPNQEQFTWLHDLLEDVREDLGAKWIIVYLNKGPHVWADDGDDLAVQQLWRPLLESFGVDLVIHSSEARYQRSFPMRAGVVTSTERTTYAQGLGPVYVMAGVAQDSIGSPMSGAPPPWLAVDKGLMHLVRVDVSNETLRVSAISSETGEVFDSFTIQQYVPPDEAPTTTPKPGGRAAGVEAILLGLVVLGAAWLRRKTQGGRA